MTIRVAYDASVLAWQFRSRAPRTGVYRVAEELLHELAGHPELDLTATALCSDDPVWAASLLRSYRSQDERGDRYRVEASSPSRLGLGAFYARTYDALAATDLSSLPAFSPRALRVRIPAHVAARVRSFDGRPRMGAGRYDVLHSTFFPLPPREVTGRVPRVLTVYDLIAVHRPQWVGPVHAGTFGRILGSVDPGRDHVACISEFTRQEFCDHTGMSPERVFVTPLAASASFHRVEDPGRIAAVRARYGIPEGAYFLSVATLEPRKNLGRLVDAFLRLAAGQPELDATLVLAGSSGLRHEQVVAAASADPALRSRIRFTGYVDEDDLAALYSGAAAFVYPSLYEGFGLPPLEAMQCGVPVIASGTTSIPEVVGDAGVLVDPHDTDALSAAMLRLGSDRALAERMRRRGLERAAGFSWRASAARVVDVYRAAVGRASRAPRAWPQPDHQPAGPAGPDRCFRSRRSA